jgi:HD-GYP domain-containing protein (c-di-GMP phosphodiesterase class II)
MEQALAELDREAGAQFDPRVVAVLRELLEREPDLLAQPPSSSLFDSGALRIPEAASGAARPTASGAPAH